MWYRLSPLGTLPDGHYIGTGPLGRPVFFKIKGNLIYAPDTLGWGQPVDHGLALDSKAHYLTLPRVDRPDGFSSIFPLSLYYLGASPLWGAPVLVWARGGDLDLDDGNALLLVDRDRFSVNYTGNRGLVAQIRADKKRRAMVDLGTSVGDGYVQWRNLILSGMPNRYDWLYYFA